MVERTWHKWVTLDDWIRLLSRNYCVGLTADDAREDLRNYSHEKLRLATRLKIKVPQAIPLFSGETYYGEVQGLPEFSVQFFR